MSDPIEVSKKAYESFGGEKWNALIDLISRSDLDELTPVQRIAHLGWWYSSEVLNGGHDQYFGNWDCFDHSEVITSLDSLGAICQSKILKRALMYFTNAQKDMPTGYDEYLAWEQEYGYNDQMTNFDLEFYDCRPEIESELLEIYLNANESEFIKWVT